MNSPLRGTVLPLSHRSAESTEGKCRGPFPSCTSTTFVQGAHFATRPRLPLSTSQGLAPGPSDAEERLQPCGAFRHHPDPGRGSRERAAPSPGPASFLRLHRPLSFFPAPPGSAITILNSGRPKQTEIDPLCLRSLCVAAIAAPRMKRQGNSSRPRFAAWREPGLIPEAGPRAPPWSSRLSPRGVEGRQNECDLSRAGGIRKNRRN